MSRVCICSDRIGSADPLSAGRALGAAFADAAPGRVQVAVVPCSGSGGDLRSALSALGWDAEFVSESSAFDLGRRLARSLVDRPERLLVDLTPLSQATPDAVAVALAGVGGTAGLSALGAHTDLVGVLPLGQESDRLLGVEGVAGRQGYAAGRPIGDVLAADARLGALASDLDVADRPGLGAAGGLALLLAAMGGRLESGFELCRRAAGLDATLAKADLVVIGTDTFTTGNFGGAVALGVAPLATALAVPCLALAREVDIAVRELRRHGVEAALALGGGADATASDIERAAGAAARTWTR